ncbi:recombination mediator RecR [Dyadobacter psychrotolerans]|uniref:Recombination protein RecR n=1 Tax=Dyadobacter psychrotolerans TaxID=2541721 RepID=A0A4R5DZL4_9BACT|nr:recombination mediator RecR [Dyadobacter psychrotolerans]TDE16693.1 recombination protein RecR [Dyadobacter psychrotolerans]
MNYPSRLIEDAVGEISRLPGIGKKTALRLALHLLKREEQQSRSLAEAIVNMRTKTTYCIKCHNIADHELCNICSNPKRDASIICVVVDTRDVLAIEATSQFKGLYHVLGGIISPLEGIGPSDLNIDSLVSRVEQKDETDQVEEVILALSPTMEGDTTAFYLQKKLKSSGVKVSTIARGVPIGGDLEYADEITLGRSIVSRVAYD